MQASARDSYLETQVLTASPFKLRLMLIEGAIRFVNQSLHHWDEGRDEAAWESSVRAREIISELMSSLTREETPLTRQILPLYSYLFRTLTEAQMERSYEKVQDALRILGEERETWQLVCEQFASELESLQAQAKAPVEIMAPQTLPISEAPRAASPMAPLAAPLGFDSSLPMAPSPLAGYGALAAAPHRSFSFEA